MPEGKESSQLRSPRAERRGEKRQTKKAGQEAPPTSDVKARPAELPVNTIAEAADVIGAAAPAYRLLGFSANYYFHGFAALLALQIFVFHQIPEFFRNYFVAAANIFNYPEKRNHSFFSLSSLTDPHLGQTFVTGSIITGLPSQPHWTHLNFAMILIPVRNLN
jgi:hypothetical protein